MKKLFFGSPTYVTVTGGSLFYSGMPVYDVDGVFGPLQGEYQATNEAVVTKVSATTTKVPVLAEVNTKGALLHLVTSSGEVVGLSEGDGLNANTDESASINLARQVKAAAGRVTSILCTTGSAITLTLYDNAAASATGRQIYSGALSAGDVVIPDAAWFAHGCYASFTGTAAFVINTSESAE